MFLNMAACYVVTPHIHQWYRINTKEILQDHELVLCDDEVAYMVPLPPSEPLAMNTYMTLPRVTLQQNEDSQNNVHSKQPQCTSTPLVNQLTEWSHQSQNVHQHNQSTIMQQQFSIFVKELQKITQVCRMA